MRPGTTAATLVCLLALGCGAPQPTPAAPTASTVPPPSRTSPPRPTPTATSPIPTFSGGPSTVKPTPPEPTCADLVEGLSLRQQVGQLLMVGMSSSGLSGSVADVLDDTRAGSVILLGNSTAGAVATRRLTDQVRRAADPPKRVKTILAADQEGGLVQRLKGPGFSTIPSAEEQAGLSDRTLRKRAAGWGEQLAAAGIDADLAPVADVVPAAIGRRNQPIGALRRGYGSAPSVVADKVAAFTRGMTDADLITATKHFPGLGQVIGNTDFVARVTDTRTRRHDPRLVGFQAAVDADVDMVMVSSAYYSRIDPDRRAAFSKKIIATMLRGDLGFDGVVISDDLSAAAMRDLSPGQRAVRFITAGGDLAIVGDPNQAAAMATALRREADDPAFRKRIATSATRVVAMKAAHGLADC